MQVIRERDCGKYSHSINRMACRFTEQLQMSLALDDKSQNLHRNASISFKGGFEQAPETDVKHYRRCCSSVRLRSWSGKSMHEQYRRFTEQPPVDIKKDVRMAKGSESFCCS